MHACPVFSVDEDINGSSGLILLPFHLFIDTDRSVTSGRAAAFTRAVIAGVALIGRALIALNASLCSAPMTGRVFGCFEPMLTAPVVACIAFSQNLIFPTVGFELIVVVNVSLDDPAFGGILHPLKNAGIKTVRKLLSIVAFTGHRTGRELARVTPRKA